MGSSCRRVDCVTHYCEHPAVFCIFSVIEHLRHGCVLAAHFNRTTSVTDGLAHTARAKVLSATEFTLIAHRRRSTVLINFVVGLLPSRVWPRGARGWSAGVEHLICGHGQQDVVDVSRRPCLHPLPRSNRDFEETHAYSVRPRNRCRRERDAHLRRVGAARLRRRQDVSRRRRSHHRDQGEPRARQHRGQGHRRRDDPRHLLHVLAGHRLEQPGPSTRRRSSRTATACSSRAWTRSATPAPRSTATVPGPGRAPPDRARPDHRAAQLCGTPDQVRVTIRGYYAVPGPDIIDWAPGTKKFTGAVNV